MHLTIIQNQSKSRIQKHYKNKVELQSCCFKQHDCNFNDASKTGLLKNKLFWIKIYDLIISVHDIINKILSCDSNCIAHVAMWPKFENYNILWENQCVALQKGRIYRYGKSKAIKSYQQKYIRSGPLDALSPPPPHSMVSKELNVSFYLSLFCRPTPGLFEWMKVKKQIYTIWQVSALFPPPFLSLWCSSTFRINASVLVNE